MSNTLKYNTDQRREYLEMIDRIGGRWLGVFDGNELFYSAQYWDLFTTDLAQRPAGHQDRGSALHHRQSRVPIPRASTWRRR